jgi:hypothetical protein
METSTQIALLIYGLAILPALWYRVASDKDRRRNERALGAAASSAQPGSGVQQRAPSIRPSTAQDGLPAERGTGRVFAKRRSSTAS